MITANAYAPDQPDFHAILTPHRSLGRQGFVILMAFLVASWIITGLFFLSQGAWPIFGFFGLDVLVVWVAFKVNYRSARQREEIRLSRHELQIAQFSPAGKQVLTVFNPFWTQLKIAKHPLIGVTALKVSSRDQMVRIGDFLNPDDRTSFAAAFKLALAKAKAR